MARHRPKTSPDMAAKADIDAAVRAAEAELSRRAAFSRLTYLEDRIGDTDGDRRMRLSPACARTQAGALPPDWAGGAGRRRSVRATPGGQFVGTPFRPEPERSARSVDESLRIADS